MRVAIIDLGSNTFHLLIVQKYDQSLVNEVFRQRIFVSLGDGGIEQLKESAIRRGLEACQVFKQKMKTFDVEKAVIIGTAAIRTAVNSALFVNEAEAIFGQKIMIIDGQQEAELIFEGVRLLSPIIERTVIMDIGGGSTEFIIAENGKIVWSESYRLGVNVLHDLFHFTEPISGMDILALKNHVKDTVMEFIVQVNAMPITSLIGSSGSFEVFESMSDLPTHMDKVNEIDLKAARTIIAKIVAASSIERQNMKGLPPERAKLVVVGMLLVDIVLDIVRPEKLIVSPFALKEGAMAKLL